MASVWVGLYGLGIGCATDPGMALMGGSPAMADGSALPFARTLHWNQYACTHALNSLMWCSAWAPAWNAEIFAMTGSSVSEATLAR